MGPQGQPKCFWHAQHMRNSWELRKRGYLIRFGHTEALFKKKMTLNGHFSRPAQTGPYVWIQNGQTKAIIHLLNWKSCFTRNLPKQISSLFGSPLCFFLALCLPFQGQRLFPRPRAPLVLLCKRDKLSNFHLFFYYFLPLHWMQLVNWAPIFMTRF